MSRRSILEDADQATDLLTLALRGLPQALDTLEDRKEGYGTGRRFDAIGSATMHSALYCPTHFRDLNDDCRAELCRGVIVATPSDPTGDAAADRADGHVDQAQATEDAIASTLRQMKDLAHGLLMQVQRLQKAEVAKPHLARQADQENERNRLTQWQCCEVCYLSENSDGSRKKEAMLMEGPSTVNGRLPQPMRLCRRHYEFVQRVGRLPNPDEERVFQQGKAPKVKAEQTSRLAAGIVTGKLT